LFIDRRGYANTARFGQPLKPGSNVDTIALEVIAVHDHVAEIDTDPKFNPLRPSPGGSVLGQRQLNFPCGSDSFNDTRKFRQNAVTHKLENAPIMFGDLWIDDVGTQGTEGCERRLFIRPNEPRVTDHIGCQDSRQSPWNALYGH